MKKHVYIHQKFYDLDKIKANHPGGYLNIFESIENEEDCTPLFESCHALKNIDVIYEMMKDFEIKEEDFEKFGITEKILNSKKKLTNYNFDSYHKLAKGIKEKIKNNHKVTSSWYIKAFFLFSLYVYLYCIGLLSDGYGIWRNLHAFLAGYVWIFFGFCVMHDASHYALFKTNSNNLFFQNDFLASLWHGWGLWNTHTWLKHHTYAHHSFTGIFGKDPDTIHGRPFFRKTEEDNKVISMLSKIQDKIYFLTLVFTPGMYFGQIIAYFVGFFRGHIWKVNIKNSIKNTKFHETVLYIISITILIFNSSYFAVYFYLVGLNLSYAVCIVPDHDTYECTIENEKETNDWCEMQIRKSGNFCEKNYLLTEIAGGINYQIQHHLFPTVYHGHYKTITPVIVQHCKENNIPYVSMETILDVIKSYSKMLDNVKVK